MQSDNNRSNRGLAHRTELTMALGCTVCSDRELCGGLKTSDGLYDCSDLCLCNSEEKKAACQFVCPSKSQEYTRRLHEVNSFDLSTVGNVAPVPVPHWPGIVPWIDGRGCLAGPLPLTEVAIPLRRLFHAGTGRAIDPDRNALAARFAIQVDTKLLVTGVSYEQPIEDFWSAARGSTFLSELAALRPGLVTTPNFSLFNDTPRDDNMYNMKRIAICWRELASYGIPTSLHLNARTDRDWERWTEFLVVHPEIASVAFEFGTGAAPLLRGRWYVRQLGKLADAVRRPLQLVVRGGRHFLMNLRSHFADVVLIATDPLMKARKRRRLTIRPNGQPTWQKVPYRKGEKLDKLFLKNVTAYRQLGLIPAS
jgi:hypothetical protein